METACNRLSPTYLKVSNRNCNQFLTQSWSQIENPSRISCKLDDMKNAAIFFNTRAFYVEVFKHGFLKLCMFSLFSIEDPELLA